MLSAGFTGGDRFPGQEALLTRNPYSSPPTRAIGWNIIAFARINRSPEPLRWP